MEYGHGQMAQQDTCLTKIEHEVYQWMRMHQGSVVTRDALLRNVWGYSVEVNTRSVDMCIRRIRSKIGNNTIRTVYGQGYVLMAQEASTRT